MPRKTASSDARSRSSSASQATARGDQTRTGGLRLVAALLAIERGDHAPALRDIPIAAKRLADQRADARRIVSVVQHLLSGLAHIQAGRLTQAGSEFEAQGRIYKGANEIERSWRRSLEGEIALARGNVQQAAAAFAAIEPTLRIFNAHAIAPSVLFNDLPSRDGLARVAIARGRSRVCSKKRVSPKPRSTSTDGSWIFGRTPMPICHSSPKRVELLHG